MTRFSHEPYGPNASFDADNLTYAIDRHQNVDTELMKDVNLARQTYGIGSQRDVDYEKSLLNELQNRHILPAVALAWAEQNMNTLGDGQNVTTNSVKQYENRSSLTPLEPALAEIVISGLHQASANDGGKRSFNRADLEKLKTSAENAHTSPIQQEVKLMQKQLVDNLSKDPSVKLLHGLFENHNQLLNEFAKIHQETGPTWTDRIESLMSGEAAPKTEYDRNDIRSFNEMTAKDPSFRRQFTPDQLNAAKQLYEQWDTVSNGSNVMSSDGEEFAQKWGYDHQIDSPNTADINYAFGLQEQTPFATLVQRAYDMKSH